MEDKASIFQRLIDLATKHGTIVEMEDGSGDIVAVADVLRELPEDEKTKGGCPPSSAPLHP